MQPLGWEIATVIVENIIYGFLVSILVVFIAKRKKELSGAFYHLLLAVLISDVVFFYILSLGFFKLPDYGIYTKTLIQYPWVGSFAYTFSVVLTIYQYFGQTMIALNRFTCVWMPMTHKKIWNARWYLPVIIVIPIMCVMHRFTAEGVYEYNPDGSLRIGYADKEFETFGLSVAAVIYGINTFFSIVLAILTVIKHTKLKKASEMISTDMSVKLLVYSLLLLFVQCIRLTYNRIRLYFLDNYVMISIIVVMLQYIVDIHAAVASIGILVLSPTTRKTYLKFYIRILRKLFAKKQRQNFVQTARITPIGGIGNHRFSNNPTV